MGENRLHQAWRTGCCLVAISLWLSSHQGLGVFAQDQANQRAKEAAPIEEDRSLAVYADAANFQTGGAVDLAIEGWRKFIREYPKDPKVSKAAHYLGVCYMQQDPPDYGEAVMAFDQALKDGQYELREESLANLGWCLYAKATVAENVNKQDLQRVVRTFQMLRTENPESRFLDRVFFYSGEAEYGLGNAGRAIKYYDQLLSMPKASKSPLRCDALYARGVAQEELEEVDSAIGSFEQLLRTCKDDQLAIDVHLRLGDLRIMRREFVQAVESFQNAIDATDSMEDQSYAIFRQAFAHVQSNQPAEAAKLYETLASEYSGSPYAASASLSAAQSLYRSGNLEEAAKRFSGVVRESRSKEVATEASHWLARIAIGKGDHAGAVKWVESQMKRGAQGEYATELRLDLADALAMNPPTVSRSIAVFEKVFREDPESQFAPRALYNAAFSALQVGKANRALALSGEFLDRFKGHPLSGDVNFVRAESSLAAGEKEQAVAIYQSLVKSAGENNPQRAVYVLRLGAATNAARMYQETVSSLSKEVASLKGPDQKAEAFLLVAQAHQSLGQDEEASTAYAQAVKASPQGPRALEARLLQGQSLLESGNSTKAREIWNAMVSSQPNGQMASQAEYKLAELEGSEGKHDEAQKRYMRILNSKTDAGLQPYAQFGVGFSNFQKGEFAQAAKTLSVLLKDFPKHTLAREALLTRGVCFRKLEKPKLARIDLERFLESQPTGDALAHALYELALVDGLDKKPAEAAKRLIRVVNEVPEYPAMDKVLYELAWALQDSGEEEQAVERFSMLISKYPNTDLASEAAYFVGQRFYSQNNWKEAAAKFRDAAAESSEMDIREKSLYRLGWSLFKLGEYEQSESAFERLAEQFSDGKLAFDARMMIGENRFKRGDFKSSLSAYQQVRREIQAANQTAKTMKDGSEQQVRELVLLHGGQSAAQLKDFRAAVRWYEELRTRFPSSRYLPQVFYETGFAYQQLGNDKRALKFFTEVAENYRNEVAARARFMMGEIHFSGRRFDQAIPEFQRVMFGFGAEQAPEEIKNWQAKSGFEAGRCSELLKQSAKTESAQKKAAAISERFYRYVVEKHPGHELAVKAKERLDALK